MDFKELFALMERFEKSGLSELAFKRNGEEVCMKKAVPVAAGPASAAPLPVPAHPPAAEAGPAHAPDTEIIRAPLVGTFFRSAAPDAPPLVEKGDTVKKGRTLCILEAMKLMNEFQAEFDLVVVNILMDNGRMVEFGAPLFEVRRA